eukprot:gene14434-5491_t
MSEESVKVAVRVRPFNKRERGRNAKLIIDMKGATTTIFDPQNPDDLKEFTFDYSYWSHDGSKELENGYFGPDGPNSKYIGQKELFSDVGAGVLDNAWSGYNTSLFAYGQTGSGKSWSVVGYGANKGIVPMFCEEIFNGIQKKRDEGSNAEFEVLFSMLEIYNEKVRDLLNPSTGKGGLKVRNHPKKGFYAEGLSVQPVKNYQDIEMRMEEGTKNRTVASTNMNATSSRAHTIVGITFTQKSKNEAGQETAKKSVVNLVDLAGSERAESTGATGDRLKEGAAINQSLSSLGNCIAALADRAGGKNVRVPYRNSVLTMLLKNALGGNSKTIMIAALSPADINYEETLSTLRYADRAKQIKTKATVNEDPTEKLIRNLKEENEKLKELLEKVLKIQFDTFYITEVKKRVEEELQARMAENAKSMDEMEQQWADRLAAAEAKNKERDEAEKKKGEEKMSTPHIYNLNPDPMLSGMIVHLLKEGDNKIGKAKQENPPDIPLVGLNIREEHASLQIKDGSCTVSVCANSRVLVNGEPVLGQNVLHHQDRIMIGSSHLYVFYHPAEAKTLKEQGKLIEISYEMAQEEIAKNAGFNMKKKEQSNEDLLVQEDLADLLPHVEQANDISQELDKKVEFELVILSAQARGKHSGNKEVFVKVKQLDSGYEWFWTRQKFINRKYVMQEMYEDFEGGESWDVPAERDPFVESPETECLIGTAEVYLKCVAYMIELEEQLNVVDYQGAEAGHLNVSVIPVDKDGGPVPEDACYVETPDQLEGKRIDFKIDIESAVGLPKRFNEVYCKYDVFTYENVKSEAFSGSRNPEFKFSKQITIDKCSKKVLDFLAEKPVIVQIWGKQKSECKKPVNKAAKEGQTTKEIMAARILKKGFLAQTQSTKPVHGPDSAKRVAENMLMKRQLEKLQSRLNQIKELCDKAEKDGGTTVSIADVRRILGINTNNAQQPTQPAAEKPPNNNITEKPSGATEAGPPQKSVAFVTPVVKEEPKRRDSNSSSSSSDGSSSEDEENKKGKQAEDKDKKSKPRNRSSMCSLL